ncbi:MAG: phytanoyl-CoA dioxygenase family protein [Pseudomonadota bacterium]
MRASASDSTTQENLLFQPVVNAAPQRLSPAQIAQYNRDGFVQPFEIFTADEVETVRCYVDKLMAAMGPSGHYGINCYQSRLAGLWDIATDSRILDCVQDLIGPDILCWATAILSKAPMDPKSVPWHQDASFWRLTPARTVTVWLAIDDADDENSAMRFLPGSHDKGALKVRTAEGDSVFHIETDGVDALGDPFTNTLRAGQISLHADMLVHGSLANRSSRRRCGLTLRYCPPSVQITDRDWAAGVEAILCRGQAGDWIHHPRPSNDDIAATSSPHVIGNN